MVTFSKKFSEKVILLKSKTDTVEKFQSSIDATICMEGVKTGTCIETKLIFRYKMIPILNSVFPTK